MPPADPELAPAAVPVAIRTICDRLGITQTELARRLGTSPETVSRWARGRRVPQPVFRRHLAHVLAEVDDPTPAPRAGRARRGPRLRDP